MRTLDDQRWRRHLEESGWRRNQESPWPNCFRSERPLHFLGERLLRRRALQDRGRGQNLQTARQTWACRWRGRGLRRSRAQNALVGLARTIAKLATFHRRRSVLEEYRRQVARGQQSQFRS